MHGEVGCVECLCVSMDFPGGTSVKICLPMSRMQKTEERRVQSLGQKDPREEEMAMHSIILAWRIPWTEDCGRLLSMDL